MKGQTYVILAILCIILISVFAVLNMSVVEVNYLFWSGSSPLIFIILFSVLFGGLITMLFGTWKIVQLKRQNRQLNAQLKQLQANTTSNDQTTNKQKQLRNQEKKDE
ncbi:MAG TPA: LapA family protein [Pseudogracilibacillus sp.]|nr:LapA family protein [Pseudogracilibacillus sp.]